MKKEMFTEIKLITELLTKNKIGIFPMKNSYMIIGLVNGNNDQIIREIKGKIIIKPIVRVILDLSSDKIVSNYYHSLPFNKKKFIEIFKYSDVVFASVKNKIGFTFATNPYERVLLTLLKKSVYASSSNISGKSTPFSCYKISKKIKSKVNFIFDIGKLTKRKDFAVINLDDLQWLREGISTSVIDDYIREMKL